MVMNYSVHAMMYSYYAVKALKYTATLLCNHSNDLPQDPCAEGAGHGDHLSAAVADGVRVRRQHPRLAVQGKW